MHSASGRTAGERGANATYDVSDSRRRSRANRSCARSRCRANRRYIIAPSPCRSSRSSSACKTFHDRKCRKANRSALWLSGRLHANTQEASKQAERGREKEKRANEFGHKIQIEMQSNESIRIEWNRKLRKEGLTGQLFALAVVGAPRIIASFGHAAVFTGEHQAVRTVVQLGLVAYALPVPVAVRYVPDDARLRLARVFLVALLCIAACERGIKCKSIPMISRPNIQFGSLNLNERMNYSQIGNELIVGTRFGAGQRSPMNISICNHKTAARKRFIRLLAFFAALKLSFGTAAVSFGLIYDRLKCDNK